MADIGAAAAANRRARYRNGKAGAAADSGLLGRYESYEVNFDKYVFGQAGDFDGGAGWRLGAGAGEVFGVDGIHGGEVVEVFEEDGGFDDLGEAASGGFEDCF